MTYHIPAAVDMALASVLPGIMSHSNPTIGRHALTVGALHFASGYLFRDTISGNDIDRLLRSITAATKARQIELNDIARVRLALLEERPWAA